MAYNEMAKYAYDEIMKAAEEKEFCDFVRSFPSMIQVNGLCASLAFLKSKKKIHKRLYCIIQEWIFKKSKVGTRKKSDLLEEILEADSSGYRLYTEEIMKLCIWMKRFGEGMRELNGE